MKIFVIFRCSCKGSCIRNCACKSASVACSKWCGCDPFKCKSKSSQRKGNQNINLIKENLQYSVEQDVENRDNSCYEENKENHELNELKTPECLPPPLSCSTIETTMTGRRKKKLFTEKLGPQEL